MESTLRNGIGLGFGAALLLALGAGCGDDSSANDADTGADADADVPDEGGGDADADVEPDAEAVEEADDGSGDDGEAGPARRLVILHTNDMHSHFNGLGPELEYTPATTGDDPTLGGAARLATLIAQRRAAAEAAGSDVLVTDSGDWLMGTLFEILDETASPALSLFQALGYDALTFGNHEFEWTPNHLADTIAAAQGLGFDVPIVAANMITDATDTRDDTLAALVADGTIAPSTTLTLPSGLVVGIIGWMGSGAAAVVPTAAPVTFGEDMAEAQTLAAGLKAAGADVVIALTHIGLSEDLGSPNDDSFAAAAPDVDIIIGGHSHDALTEVRMAGTTPIVQAGEYGKYLGELTVDVSDAGVAVVSYELHAIDDTIAGDATTQATVEGWIDLLDTVLLAFDLAYLAPVAETAFDVTRPGMAESNLGDLVTDAFRVVTRGMTASDPVLVAFESDGVIRDDLLQGNNGVLCAADVFRVLPNGIGLDGLPGYPMVSFWVTGLELRTACEVSASLSPVAGSDYFIQISGMRCQVVPSNPWLDRVVGVYLGDDELGYSATSIDLSGTDTTLYRVAVDLYVASLMSVISERTLGGLSIEPKNADGTPVTEMTAMRLDTEARAGVQELKLWEALFGYVSALPDEDGDGLPEIPAMYSTPLGRYDE